jgi:hypothetical protein
MRNFISAIAFVYAVGVFLRNDLIYGVTDIRHHHASSSRQGRTANSPNPFV